MGYCPFQQQNKIKKPRLLLSMHKALGSSLEPQKRKGRKRNKEKHRWEVKVESAFLWHNEWESDSILERESLEEIRNYRIGEGQLKSGPVSNNYNSESLEHVPSVEWKRVVEAIRKGWAAEKFSQWKIQQWRIWRSSLLWLGDSRIWGQVAESNSSLEPEISIYSSSQSLI